jgi:Tfp pilus assembly protein PilF
LQDQASRKAIQLDDSLSEAHNARANALVAAWKWSEAEPEYRRAIELNPNNATAHYFYAFAFLIPQKHFDQAQEEFHTALSLDPLSSVVNMNYAVLRMMQGRYPESQSQFNKVIESNPAFQGPHFYLSELYASMGRFAEAVSELQKIAPLLARLALTLRVTTNDCLQLRSRILMIRLSP